jgi:hypothetical protein
LRQGKAISDSHDARKNHAIAREIELELCLEKVIGPYDRDANEPRPDRAPKRWEMYRGMATGLDPRDIAAEVTELYHQSDNGLPLRPRWRNTATNWLPVGGACSFSMLRERNTVCPAVADHSEGTQ